MSEWNHWYVNVDDTTVGPVSTDLVIKGIEHRRIPFEAVVCVVGGTTWVSLASIDAFRDAVMRSYPPPPPDSYEANLWLARGFCFPKPAPLPRAEDLIAAPAPHRPKMDSGLDVEIEWADAGDGDGHGNVTDIEWTRGFCGYFLTEDAFELPDEPALLASLAGVPHEAFLHDEALWNLALCLAFGSDRLGEAAGRTFFASVMQHGNVDRLAWMSRTLLGNGFVPSGLPAAAGQRAFERLRALCPTPPDTLDAPATARVA